MFILSYECQTGCAKSGSPPDILSKIWEDRQMVVRMTTKKKSVIKNMNGKVQQNLIRTSKIWVRLNTETARIKDRNGLNTKMDRNTCRPK